MNQHLEIAVKIYEQDNINFHQLLAWHLAFGFVASCESYFTMGFYCSHEDPTAAVEPQHADTIFCTFCTGDMLQALGPFIGKYKHLAFQRSFKGSDRIRLFCINNFYSKLK